MLSCIGGGRMTFPPSCPRSISVVLASLWLFSILLAARVASAEGPPRSLGFSNLVVRFDGDDPVGIATADFRVQILDELRNHGLAVVNAEGQTAELVLAGTVRGLECRTLSGACRVAIEWELREAGRQLVLYRAFTRAAAYRVDFQRPAGAGSTLVLGALHSLTARPAFRSRLLRTAESDAATAFVDFDDPVPSFDPELDAAKAQAAAAQRAREERELQERMAARARVADEKEQKKRAQALTPGYVKVMKWAGAGLFVAGGIAAVATFTAFDDKQTTQPAYDRLKLGNDLAWAAMALGAASFGLSFALTPSLPAKPAQQRALAVDLKQSQVQVRLCF
jgi:hypothetical protein